MLTHYTSKIIRALRKFNGMTQGNFAQIIEVSQSAMSKIESSILELNAIQWVFLCKKFNLDPRALLTGKIEFMTNDKLQLKNADYFGSYRIPKQFSQNMGATVRSIYPYISLIDREMGEGTFGMFAKLKGFDKDYFVIQNAPLSIVFVQEVYRFMQENSLITSKNLSLCNEESIFKSNHTNFFDHANNSNLVENYIKLLNVNYDVDSDYKYKTNHEIIVDVHDGEHLKNLNLSSGFISFKRSQLLRDVETLNAMMNIDLRVKLEQYNGHWSILRAS